MEENGQKHELISELNKLDGLTYILDELENLNTSEHTFAAQSSINILEKLARYCQWDYSYAGDAASLGNFKQNIERARASIDDSKKLIRQKLKQLNKQ